MFRFHPSVESLETRETPSSSLSSVTDLVVDSYSLSGPGVYKSVDSGGTWTLAPDTTSSDPLPVLMVIANRDY